MVLLNALKSVFDIRPVAKRGSGGSRDPPRQSKALLTHCFGYTVGLTFQSPKSYSYIKQYIHIAPMHNLATCNLKLSYLIVMIVFTEHRAIQRLRYV